MVSASSGERVQPVLLTAHPSSSSHGERRSIWVERPTPSVPSMTIRCPGSTPMFTYGSPYPNQDLPRFPPPPRIVDLGRPWPRVSLQHPLHLTANGLLLGRDVGGRIDHAHTELRGDLVVVVEHAALEEPEAVDGIGGQADVHTGLVVLELGAAGEEALQRHLDRHAEVEGQIGTGCEAVHLAEPLGMDAARDVASECGIDVPVGEHDHPGLQWWHDLVGE